MIARPADRTIHQHPHPAITSTPWCTSEVFHHSVDGISKPSLRKTNLGKQRSQHCISAHRDILLLAARFVISPAPQSQVSGPIHLEHRPTFLLSRPVTRSDTRMLSQLIRPSAHIHRTDAVYGCGRVRPFHGWHTSTSGGHAVTDAARARRIPPEHRWYKRVPRGVTGQSGEGAR